MELCNQGSLKLLLCEGGNVGKRKQIVVVEMHQIWRVKGHFSHYVLWVVIVAESEKRWKAEFDWKYLDGARTIKLVSLSGIDLLVESVE
jgi:hypothetical protein